MKLKLIPLLLCLCLLAACLTGCGGEPVKVEVTASPAPAETPAPTEAPAATEAPTEVPSETPDPEEEARKARYQAAYEKFKPDQSVVRVGNDIITWAEYYSWIYDIATQVDSAYHITDWNEPRAELASIVPESTFGAYVCKEALEYITLYSIIRQKAAEMGIELTQEQRDSIQAEVDGYIEKAGGREAFEQRLAEAYVPMEYFSEQQEAISLYNNIFESMYGADGADLPEEDAVAYMKDNGYLFAKHILFRTVDDNRQPLSEEESAGKKAEAQEVLAQLQACPPEDLPELFDSLMKQYSEDTGMLAYPNGYYFRSGEMVAPFEEAVLALEENGLSDLVESDYGFHIIFCPPMRGDDLMDYDSNYMPVTLKSYVSSQLFNNVVDEWMESALAGAKAAFEKGFNPLDLNELFQIPQN